MAVVAVADLPLCQLLIKLPRAVEDTRSQRHAHAFPGKLHAHVNIHRGHAALSLGPRHPRPTRFGDPPDLYDAISPRVSTVRSCLPAALLYTLPLTHTRPSAPWPQTGHLSPVTWRGVGRGHPGAAAPPPPSPSARVARSIQRPGQGAWGVLAPGPAPPPPPRARPTPRAPQPLFCDSASTSPMRAAPSRRGPAPLTSGQ